MGCDGGTIPKRDELVRTKKKPEQKDRTSELSFRWKHCALTQQPLEPPIVACEMGRLYSKVSVLEALLDKSDENPLREVAPHIKSLKDVKEICLTENALFSEAARGEIGDGYIDVQKSKWVCPMSGLEMNGRFRFCFLWTCGCVISEKALKEMMKMKEDGNECLKCQKVFRIIDVILMNPTEEHDIELLKEKMELRRILAKEAKEAKKAAKKKPSAAASATATSDNSSDLTSSDVSSSKKDEQTSKDQEGANGKRAHSKTDSDDISESPSSSKKSKIIPKPTAAATEPGSSKGRTKTAKPGTSAYSVAQDPKASEVYKSLFTTHQTAQTQERAHWITYNPFYN